MDATPRLEDAVPATAATPSSTSSLVRAPCARTDAPTRLESSENTLNALEDATRAGDVSAICNILQLVRRQYSQEDRRHWKPDVVRRLWNDAVKALGDTAAPEVGARACQLIEVLAQNCKSCIEGVKETVFHEEAPKQVIRAMEKYPSDLSVQSSCLRALLSMSGCMTCRSFYDKETQDLMGKSNAVSALVYALANLQQLTTKMQFETNAHKLARLAIADAVQTLHYICLMHEENTAQLAAVKGLHIIHTSIEDNLNELTVQEHGCMLLAELGTSTAVSEQEVLECVGAVTNVARLQMQEKFIEVARAAVWSLARIAGNVLHPCHCHSREASWSKTLSQVWPIMQGQALSMIMGMIQSCQLKNDALVKHCLDFIAVVGGEDGLPAPAMKTLENFRKAIGLVYDLFIETDDARIKAASIRTLFALMSNPYGPCTESEDSIVSLDTLLHAMRTAHMCREASERDTFSIQVFGSILISRVSSPGVILKSSQISEYIQHVHEAVGDIIRYIVDGGEEFFFDNSDSRPKAIEIHDVLAAIAAASKFLRICGRDGVNFFDAKGQTLLHKLAQSGLKECLQVFVEICGSDIDFLQRTAHGATALNLAHASPDPSCAVLIEKATERAEQAQDALPSESTVAQQRDARSSAMFKKQRKKKTGLSAAAEVAELGLMEDKSDLIRPQQEESERQKRAEEDERLKVEEEYERALAERRRQLEDMEAVFSKKPPGDKLHHCSEKKAATKNQSMHRATAVLSVSESSLPKKTSTRFLGKDNEVLGLSVHSDIQRQQQILGSSISVGSGTNNGSPDPAAAPAGPDDDHIIGTTVSAFQTRSPPLGLGALPSGDERMTGTWHSLFAADPDAAQGGTENKWSMLSSSSGQNNHTTMDADRQSSFIQQQIWPPLSNQPRQQAQPEYGGTPSQEALVSEIPGTLIHPSVSSCLPDDDVADDTQILSWLSSEITGLIGNGPPADRATTEMQRARDFQSEGVPPPPPQNIPSPYENAIESTGFLPMGASVSPFYNGNPMAMSPYMHPAPGNFSQSRSSPWGNVAPNAMALDPRLIPQSEINSGDGRPSVHPSRFWHTEENDIPSKHLWLGNLNTRLPKPVLKSVFEEYGPIEDVVTFPGRMYAFVNFIQPEDAQRAAKELDNMTLPVLTGNRKLVIKFRPNRKALGRVGDLMPGVANIEECNSGAIAPSISVPVLRSSDMSSSQQSGGDGLPQNQAFMEGEHPQERQLLGEREDAFDTADRSIVLGSSCRHLWLGNVCVRPSKTVLFSLFSRYGPVESVRVFPGKTYAFVNFYSGEHAYRAKEALDGKTLAAVTGTKPLVVRFQREGAGPAGWARVQDNFNNIPPLQSAESAPGAYVTNNMVLPQDRPNLEVHGGYRSPSTETQRPQSLSPEDYPPLNRSVRGTESTYYDLYQTDRRQKSTISEGEVKWSDGMSKADANVSGPGTSGGIAFSPDRLNSVTISAAMEASSIGHLTRTLSAAAFGKAQRLSPYMRPAPLDRPWNPPVEGGLDDRGLHSSYSTTLSSSHSFGGYDAKGYTSPFFHPQLAPIHSSSSLSQSHFWTQPRPQDAALSSQPFIGNPGFLTDEASVQMSLPQEPLIASGGTSQVTSDLDPSQGQQSDSPGFVSSAVISCDKGGIW